MTTQTTTDQERERALELARSLSARHDNGKPLRVYLATHPSGTTCYFHRWDAQPLDEIDGIKLELIATLHHDKADEAARKVLPTTAGAVAINHETLSPVSGTRCRGCGANAVNRDHRDRWYIADMAAWCAECAAEEYAVKPAGK